MLLIPPSLPYQSPIFPLPDLSGSMPPEGPYKATLTFPWTTGGLNAFSVPFQQNSPVAMSKIAAMSVDNTRCECDVEIVFPSTSMVLPVPAKTYGVYPVFTTGLDFFVVANNAGTGETTTIQVHNSMPPPVAISNQQGTIWRALGGISLGAVASDIIAANLPATITKLVFSWTAAIPAGGGSAIVSMSDGAAPTYDIGRIAIGGAAGTNVADTVVIDNLQQRVFTGANINVESTSIVTGTLYFGVYGTYSSVV